MKREGEILKIVVAPDSFKGSISARDLCRAVKAGVARVFPQAEVVELPLADGGEGTVENMVYATGGSLVRATARDPLGRPVEAQYGVMGDGQTVVIEVAQASGLPLLGESERNPLTASSRGTGELILDALERGYRRFIIGLGGSAVNDGGAGMMRALGVEFLDASGRPVEEGGAGLARLDRIDVSKLDSRVGESEFVAASDVTNPLCGPRGASAVFGPQKGATPEMVGTLDRALQRYGEAIERQLGRAVAEQPGAGAAGGMGAALAAFLRADVRSGIDIVMELIRFEERIAGADFILTGEGKLDEQTLSGKVIAGVSRRARNQGVPVIGICGTTDLSYEQEEELGIVAGFSIAPGPCSLEQAMANAEKWTIRRVEQMMRLWETFGRWQEHRLAERAQ